MWSFGTRRNLTQERERDDSRHVLNATEHLKWVSWYISSHCKNKKSLNRVSRAEDYGLRGG